MKYAVIFNQTLGGDDIVEGIAELRKCINRVSGRYTVHFIGDEEPDEVHDRFVKKELIFGTQAEAVKQAALLLTLSSAG